MASLKRQFTELLSDIGFVKEGLRAREIEKRAQGGDGVLDATGEEVKHMCLSGSLQFHCMQLKYGLWRHGQSSLQPSEQGLARSWFPLPTNVSILCSYRSSSSSRWTYVCSEAISICWSLSVSQTRPSLLGADQHCPCLFVCLTLYKKSSLSSCWELQGLPAVWPWL